MQNALDGARPLHLVRSPDLFFGVNYEVHRHALHMLDTHGYVGCYPLYFYATKALGIRLGGIGTYLKLFLQQRSQLRVTAWSYHVSSRL